MSHVHCRRLWSFLMFSRMKTMQKKGKKIELWLIERNIGGRFGALASALFSVFAFAVWQTCIAGCCIFRVMSILWGRPSQTWRIRSLWRSQTAEDAACSSPSMTLADSTMLSSSSWAPLLAPMSATSHELSAFTHSCCQGWASGPLEHVSPVLI